VLEMARKAPSNVSRRAFLIGAAAGASLPSAAQGQAQKSPSPMNRSSRDRVEEALARIADPQGEGARACLTIYADAARAEADAADERARDGRPLGPLDGAIISIKDLFDIAGEPTRAGSKVLADALPAAVDAPVVSRLRAAGAAIVAKTNMSEFAFSGVGVNPHYGTPGNPADRARAPGGSSSGAAVAIADGMCEIGIGSDTGGSTRIPAALCGIAGFKPSKNRVPTDGAFPLSYTLDSIGPLAKTVALCAAADAVMAGIPPWTIEPLELRGLRLGIPQGLPLHDLDATVTARFDNATAMLERAGVVLSDETVSLFDDMARMSAGGTFPSIEAFSIHRERLRTRAAEYDPFVRTRIERGGEVPAADYIQMLRDRLVLVRAMDTRLSYVDALVLPTTPIAAPTIAEVSIAETFFAKNLLLLRNTGIANFFDLCAISIPLPRAGGLPTGLMLIARNGEDQKLLRIAAAVERLFAS
jgi:aspartyl-tRNA(Asn)/glutamyl-tRNA(Gln) amidotransferase subunit A